MYSKYFMPESMYFLVFSVSALLFFRGFFLLSAPAMLGAGVVAGLAYYVKPHAVFIVAGSALFLLCAGGPMRRRLRTTMLYAAGFVLVVVAGRLLIHKPDNLAALGVYDQMARGMLPTLAAMFSDPGKTWRAVSTVAQGHLVVLLSLWTIAVLSALSSVRALRRGVAERQDYFRVWLLMLATLLFGVVVAFTVLAGEVGRLHSRYYCFLYPFLLVALFTYQPGAHSRREKLLMSAVAAAAGLALLALPGYAGALSISLVSDAPELGFVFVSPGAMIALALLLVGAQVAAVWRGRNALLVMLAIVFVASQFYVRQAQSHMFRGPYTDGRDALMVEQLLGDDGLKSALVLAESRDALSKFLFNLTVIPSVRIQPLARLADAVRDFPHASAYLLLTDSLAVDAGLNCAKIGQRVVRCVRR
jgi:phosphoglycerol transferase